MLLRAQNDQVELLVAAEFETSSLLKVEGVLIRVDWVEGALLDDLVKTSIKFVAILIRPEDRVLHQVVDHREVAH